MYCLVSSSARKLTEPRRSLTFFLASSLSSCSPIRFFLIFFCVLFTFRSITLGKSLIFFRSELSNKFFSPIFKSIFKVLIKSFFLFSSPSSVASDLALLSLAIIIFCSTSFNSLFIFLYSASALTSSFDDSCFLLSVSDVFCISRPFFSAISSGSLAIFSKSAFTLSVLSCNSFDIFSELNFRFFQF